MRNLASTLGDSDEAHGERPAGNVEQARVVNVGVRPDLAELGLGYVREREESKSCPAVDRTILLEFAKEGWVEGRFRGGD